MNTISQILSAGFLFGSTWFSGWWLTRLLGVAHNWERLGLAGLLGSAWLTIVLLAAHLGLRIPFTAELVGAVLIFNLVSLGTLYKLQGGRWFELAFITKFLVLPVWQQILVVLVIVPVVLSLIPNVVWPVTDWDALALYDFRAKVLIAEGSWKSGFTLGYFFQYPPFTSLLHAANYALGFQAAKVWYTLIYLSFVITFYALLRRRTTRGVSLFGAVLLAYSPHFLEHATVAYTNLAYSAFLALGIVYLWLAGDRKTPSRDWLVGTLLVALSLWVRSSEPFWVVGAGLLTIAVLRQRSWSVAVGGVFVLYGAKRAWLNLVYLISQSPVQVALPNNEQSQQTNLGTKLLSIISQVIPVSYLHILTQPLSTQGSHILAVFRYLLAYVWPLINYLFVPWLAVQWHDLRHQNWYRLLVMNGTIWATLILIFTGTYIFSFVFVTWDQIGGSVMRMSMFLVALIWFYILSCPVWNNWFKET